MLLNWPLKRGAQLLALLTTLSPPPDSSAKISAANESLAFLCNLIYCYNTFISPRGEGAGNDSQPVATISSRNWSISGQSLWASARNTIQMESGYWVSIIVSIPAAASIPLSSLVPSIFINIPGLWSLSGIRGIGPLYPSPFINCSWPEISLTGPEPDKYFMDSAIRLQDLLDNQCGQIDGLTNWQSAGCRLPTAGLTAV